jgi:hypothetical protein
MTYVWIDDEKSAQSDSCFFDEDAIVAGNGLGEVCGQRVLETAKATFLSRGVDPGKVGEVGVGGNADHL